MRVLPYQVSVLSPYKEAIQRYADRALPQLFYAMTNEDTCNRQLIIYGSSLLQIRAYLQLLYYNFVLLQSKTLIYGVSKNTPA